MLGPMTEAKGSFGPEAWKQLQGLVSRGYLYALEEGFRRLSAPFWWHDPQRGVSDRLQGGTMCFVHTGRRLLGVTAGHIHKEIVDLRA
jgi:hypothetical protein